MNKSREEEIELKEDSNQGVTTPLIAEEDDDQLIRDYDEDKKKYENQIKEETFEEIVHNINRKFSRVSNRSLTSHRMFVDDVNIPNIIIEDKDLIYVIKDIIIASLPISMSLLFVFLLETINIVYVGSFGNAEMLGAVGLGTTFVNIIGTMPIMGLQGGIDTLCSQAFGAKEYKLVGIYTSISRLVAISYFLIIFLPLSIFSDKIFILLGQNEAMVAYCSQFVHSMIIPVFFIGQREVLSRYLQSMLFFKPSMIITLLTLGFHFIWADIFILKLDLRVYGAGIAMLVTQVLNVSLLIGYIYFSSEINKDTMLITSSDTFKLKYIKTFLKLAIPAAFLCIIETLAFEVLTIISSFIGVIEMSATLCLFNFSVILFYFNLGIANAASTYVGNCIGERNEKMARKYINASLCYTLAFAVICQIVIYFYKFEIISMYTSSPEIIDVFYRIIPYFNIYLIFDQVQVSLAGIIKGLGRQEQAAKIMMIVIYFIGVPLQLILTFTMEQGVIGLWRGQFCIVVLILFGFVYIFKSKSVEDTIQELDEGYIEDK